MESEQLIGFGLILLGAICGGSFGLPSKYTKEETPWEVLWGPFFLIVTLIIPCVVAPLVVDDLSGVYARAGTGTILAVLIFGMLWGLGSMTLGMSFAFIGLSLAYALNYGAQIIFGSMIPMLLFNADQILTPHGYMILAGVAVCLVGVVVSGRAGILKDRSLRQDTQGVSEDISKEVPETEPATSQAESLDTKKPRILIGVIVGVVSGVLCACYAVASGYADPIKVEASENNPEWVAAWAVTAMILWGGAISSCLYCVVQLTKNRTWGHLAKPGAGLVVLLAAAMAVLHDAAIFFFGLGWIHLGNLGVPVGYPVFMSLAIIVGNIHGFRTGEWKGASRQSIAWLLAGIGLLIVGVCVLAAGKTIMSS